MHISKPITRLVVKIAQRVWGEEHLVFHTPDYTLKILARRAGSIGPLQYHRMKDERTTLFLGKARIFHDEGSGVLTEKIVVPGDAYHFPPGAVHREDAIEDCIFIEVSNPVFNDRVRMEGEYGLPSPDPYGLPTTTFEEIVVTNTWDKVRTYSFQ